MAMPAVAAATYTMRSSWAARLDAPLLFAIVLHDLCEDAYNVPDCSS